MTTAINPLEVDIRLAVGTPVGNTPVMLICPFHDDRVGSLAVYRDNCNCFGCSYHLKRRFAALAFLIGAWNGVGSEESERVRRAVVSITPRLHEFVGTAPAKVNTWTPPPISDYDVELFHSYLLRYKRNRLEDELIGRRGYDIETIKRFRLGHTGSHFTIPVPNLDNGYKSIRYRADDGILDKDEPDFRKYEGTWGHNQPCLFPLSSLRGVRTLEALWITEGEYDAISVIQAGDTALTVTGGVGNCAKVVQMIAALGIQVDRWVIAVDQDNAGNVASDKLMRKLYDTGEKATRARWDTFKDLTEYYGAGGKRGDVWYEA